MRVNRTRPGSAQRPSPSGLVSNLPSRTQSINLRTGPPPEQHSPRAFNTVGAASIRSRPPVPAELLNLKEWGSLGDCEGGRV